MAKPMDFPTAIEAARSENAHGVEMRRGRKYTTVAVRVEIARRHFGAIGIATEIVHWGVDNGQPIVIRATVTDEHGRVLATGTAEEIRGQGNVNKTSALENAETSAIGRALASLGLNGGEFASADEMTQAKAASAAPETPAQPQIPQEVIDATIQRMSDAPNLSALQARWNDLSTAMQKIPEVRHATNARKKALQQAAEAGIDEAPIPQADDAGDMEIPY